MSLLLAQKSRRSIWGAIAAAAFLLAANPREAFAACTPIPNGAANGSQTCTGADATISYTATAGNLGVTLSSETAGSVTINDDGGARNIGLTLVGSSGAGATSVSSSGGDVTLTTALGTGVSASNHDAVDLTTTGSGKIVANIAGIIRADSIIGGSAIAPLSVRSVDGSITLNVSGSIFGFNPPATSLLRSQGIEAIATGNGSITINMLAGSSIGAPLIANESAAGIVASTVNGSIDIETNGSLIFGGVSASSTGTGDITINRVNSVSTVTEVVANNAVSFGSSGNISITTDQGNVSALIINASTGNISITTTSGFFNSITGAISSAGSTGSISISNLGNAAGILVVNAGSGGIAISDGAGAIVSSGAVAINVTGHSAISIQNAGTINGNLGIETTGGSTTLINAGSITGSAGTAVQFGGTGNTLIMEGPTAKLVGAAIGSGNDTFRFAGTGAASFDVSQIGAGFALLDKVESSVWTLTGTGTFAGAVTINGGTLAINGDIHSASSLTVDNGGTLSGSGVVGNTFVASGGIFAPGNGSAGSSMTVAGNLAFQSGAIYIVQVSPSTASFTNVTGSATLGGATVNAIFASGIISKTYTILTASGGVSGTFGPTVVNTNLPSNFSDTLSYDATHAYLNLSLKFGSAGGPNFGGGLSGNQQAVSNALINFFNSTGGIPALYGMLNAAGLTQASGESATGSQQTTFGAMSQFINLLTDPIGGRGSGLNGATSPTGFADEEGATTNAAHKGLAAERDAYAMFTKAPPVAFAQRWSVWAAGYSGSQSTSGNAALGSNDVTSRIAGTAVGADYLYSPNTLAGFALAGGGTNFSVNNLGSGRSDLFQAGAYVRHTKGNAYITGALAYGWQDITTDRIVTIAGIDHLRAEFNANAYSGRVEGGYRYVVRWIGGVGLTPYAAGQFNTFELPAYAESVVSGAPAFALNYAGKSVTDSRSELGIRTDKSFAVQNGVLTLRGRLAWAHDFDPDRAVAATFQALPGASFVVNGAAQASDSAMSTASAEMKWMNGWSMAATFEGEFSKVARSYSGKGVVHYAW